MRSLEFDIRFTQISQATSNKYVSLDIFCNSVTIKNVDGTNTDTVTINGNVVLQPGDDVNHIPGESFTIPGNYGELFKGRIQIMFSGAAGKALVIEKYYKNYDKICNP